MPDSRDLELAFAVSDLAAEVAVLHFGAGVSVASKPDGSPVTTADLAVERLLRESLLEAGPGDAVLGEEFGRVGQSDRVWILDPIAAPGSSSEVTRTGAFTSRCRCAASLSLRS